METVTVNPALNLTSDAALPDGVLAILAVGRAELESRRAAERDRVAREAAERKAAWDAAFSPAQALVRTLVPAELQEWIDWREEDHVKKEELPYRFNQYTVVLKVPGCKPLQFSVVKNDDGTWGRYYRFPEWVWLEREGYAPHAHVASTDIDSPYAALAMAREVWLAEQRHKEEIPF